MVARSSIVDGSNNHLDELSSLKAIVVTRVHKAIYPQERARIQKSGGTVSSNGRLQGRLEVSRAFGDRQFKKFGVVATPDIHSFEVTERDHFIILGCDGLWGLPPDPLLESGSPPWSPFGSHSGPASLLFIQSNNHILLLNTPIMIFPPYRGDSQKASSPP